MTSTEFRRKTRLPQRPVGRKAGFMLNGVEVSSDDIRIKNALIALPPKKPRKPKKKSQRRILAEEEEVAKEIAHYKQLNEGLEDFQLMTEDAPRDFYTIKRKRTHSHKHRHKQPTSSHDIQQPGSSSLLNDCLTQQLSVIQESSNTSKILQQKDVSVNTAAASIQQNRNSSLHASQPIFDSSISILKDDSIRRQSSVIQNISECNEVARKEVSIHTATALQIESPLRISFNNQQIYTSPTKSISIVEESPPLIQHQSQPKENEESQKENIQNIEDEAISINDESEQIIINAVEIDEQMEDVIEQSSANQPTIPKKKKKRTAAIKRYNKAAAKKAMDGLESCCFNIKKTIEDDKLKDKISEDDKKKVLDKCQETLSWLVANQKTARKKYEDHQKELEAICNPIISKLSAGGMPGAGGPGAGGDAGVGGPTIEQIDLN